LEVGTAVEHFDSTNDIWCFMTLFKTMLECINYLITIYSTYLNTIVDGLNFIEKRKLLVGAVKY